MNDPTASTFQVFPPAALQVGQALALTRGELSASVRAAQEAA